MANDKKNGHNVSPNFGTQNNVDILYFAPIYGCSRLREILTVERGKWIRYSSGIKDGNWFRE